jgi:AraC-like DNA-binding protein
MYRELPPPPSIRRHVACFWVHVADHDGTHAVVPDACADLISVDGSAPVIVGPATSTQQVELATGTVIVGARFRPGSIATALGVDAHELVDRDVDLADVWGRTTRELVARIEGVGIAAQLAAFERELVARLANRNHTDPLAAHATAWLARHPGAHVEQLARELAISPRQLQRRVRAATGYAPKLLHRILRFQRALVALADPPRSLARIAADAGYLDQAHMTRELRALSGATPRELAGRDLDTSSMSEFFKTAERAATTVAA